MNPLIKPQRVIGTGTLAIAGLLTATVLASGLSNTLESVVDTGVRPIAFTPPDKPGKGELKAVVDANGQVRFYRDGKVLGPAVPVHELNAYLDYDTNGNRDAEGNFQWDGARNRYVPPKGDKGKASTPADPAEQRRKRQKDIAKTTTELGAQLGRQAHRFGDNLANAAKTAKSVHVEVPGKPAVKLPVTNGATLAEIAFTVGIAVSGAGNWYRNKDVREAKRAFQGKITPKMKKQAAKAAAVIADAWEKERRYQQLRQDAKRLERAGRPGSEEALKRAEEAKKIAADARKLADEHRTSYVRYETRKAQNKLYRAYKNNVDAQRDVEPAADAERESRKPDSHRPQSTSEQRERRLAQAADELAKRQATTDKAVEEAKMRLLRQVGDTGQGPKTVRPGTPGPEDPGGKKAKTTLTTPKTVTKQPTTVRVPPSNYALEKAFRGAGQVRAGLGPLQGVAPPYSHREIHDNRYLPTAYTLAQALQDAPTEKDRQSIKDSILQYVLPDAHKRKTFLEALRNTYRPQIVPDGKGNYVKAVNPIRTEWEEHIARAFPVNVPTPRELAIQKQEQIDREDARCGGPIKKPLTPRELAVRKQEQIDREQAQRGSIKKPVYSRKDAIRKQEQIDRADVQRGVTVKKHVITPREAAIRKQEQIDREQAQRGSLKAPETKKTRVPTSRKLSVRKQEQIDRADVQRGVNKTPEAKKARVPTSREVSVRKQEQIDRADVQRGVNKTPATKKTTTSKKPAGKGGKNIPSAL